MTGAALVLFASFGGIAAAQQKALYVAAYGGSFEQTLRKEVFPPFEREHGLKIEYVAGNSTDNLARLQAQKGNQQIDVAILDDGPMYQAVTLGFRAPLAASPAYDGLYDLAKALMIGMNGTGIMYNKEVFDASKWPAPASWNEFRDPCLDAPPRAKGARPGRASALTMRRAPCGTPRARRGYGCSRSPAARARRARA